MFAYQCGGQTLRNQSQVSHKYILVLEPKFSDKFYIHKQFSGEPPFWRLWASRCIHLSTQGADTVLLCLSNTTIFNFFQDFKCVALEQFSNLVPVKTQSNRIMSLIVMDISHKQCFCFMSLKDANIFDKSGIWKSIPCTAYFMAIAKAGNLCNTCNHYSRRYRK